MLLADRADFVQPGCVAIAPTVAGGKDGGSVRLFSLDPEDRRGVEAMPMEGVLERLVFPRGHIGGG